MNREGFIGGSDAKRIAEGDWHTLYLEKLGLKPPENLDHNFQVLLGLATEKFHLDWLHRECGFEIRHRGLKLAMKGHPQIQANLDGWSDAHGCFIEVKHSNSRATRESMVDWYQPQVAHYCNVAGAACGIISYIAGNAAPDWFKLAPSETYCAELLKMELAFWWHVENKVPPEALPDAAKEIAKLAVEVRLDDMRVVDMTGSNAWTKLSFDYLLNASAAATFDRAKKELKELVEPDVRLAHGNGLMIKRSKSGSLLFSEGKP